MSQVAFAKVCNSPPTGNLSPEVHAKLDEIVQDRLSTLFFELHADFILFTVLGSCMKAYQTDWPSLLAKLIYGIDVKALLESSHHTGEYCEIRERGKWHHPSETASDTHLDLT